MQTCWWIDEAAGAEMQPARHSYRCSRIHALYHVVSKRRLSESGCDSEMTEQRTGPTAVLPDGCPSLSLRLYKRAIHFNPRRPTSTSLAPSDKGAWSARQHREPSEGRMASERTIYHIHPRDKLRRGSILFPVPRRRAVVAFNLPNELDHTYTHQPGRQAGRPGQARRLASCRKMSFSGSNAIASSSSSGSVARADLDRRHLSSSTSAPPLRATSASRHSPESERKGANGGTPRNSLSRSNVDEEGRRGDAEEQEEEEEGIRKGGSLPRGFSLLSTHAALDCSPVHPSLCPLSSVTASCPLDRIHSPPLSPHSARRTPEPTYYRLSLFL